MQRKNLLRKMGLPRVPLPAGIINVNFCKNPACPNFGIPAQVANVKQGRGNTSPDGYVVKGGADTAGGTRIPMLHCKKCGEYPTLKSNEGIRQEYERLSSYLNHHAKTFICPKTTCPNHNKKAMFIHTKGKQKNQTSNPMLYRLYGKTLQGATRVQCKECGKVFTPFRATPIAWQKKSHINKSVFSLLMNKMPLGRICEHLDITYSTLYNKIDFIHRQCMAFIALREKKWIEEGFAKVYVSVDRQNYTVNWEKRHDKRNIVLNAIGSADNETGYVFAMNLNYTPSLDPVQINKDAVLNGDPLLPLPFRKYAYLWLDCDYEEAVSKKIIKKREDDLSGNVLHMVQNTYTEAVQREDVEVSEKQSSEKRLPYNGMQVHSEYTLYGHFFLLKHFFQNVDIVRFFLDQDSGMRAGALAAFCDRIKGRSCDTFYVRINKNMTINERKAWFTEARRAWKEKKSIYPEWDNATLERELMKEALDKAIPLGKWNDIWIRSPLPSMNEPEKAMCYLTDYKDYDRDHIAALYGKASLSGIDRFFMQVRRRISLLERPIGTSSDSGRMWYGYSAYNPVVIVKMLDIFRVFYNYTRPGKDKRTPAMRIGMAKGVVDLDDILYFYNVF